MQTIKKQFQKLFVELDAKIEGINHERRAEGLFPVAKAKIQLLGQISLLIHDRASLVLSLAQTGDMDALLSMEHVIKVELNKQLIREAIASEEFPNLVDRILENGGKLETFL